MHSLKEIYCKVNNHVQKFPQFILKMKAICTCGRPRLISFSLSFFSLVCHRNSAAHIARADFDKLLVGTASNEGQHKICAPIARAFVAMVDAHRTKVSARIQSTHGPNNGITCQTRNGHSAQPTEHQRETEIRYAIVGQTTNQSEANH